MIIPTERSFIGEKLVRQDSRSYTIKGHYGAVIQDGEAQINFFWGNKTKTFSKNRKWNKKLRYILNKNKGSAATASVPDPLRIQNG